MSDSAMTGGDPDTVEATGHQTVTTDAGEPAGTTDGGSIFDALDAEAAEERHLDERHATGEHYTGGDGEPADTESDPLAGMGHS